MSNWKIVGEAITHRMKELGLSQAEVVSASGVSDTKLCELQRGVAMNPRPATLSKVSRAIRWQSDGIELILKGAGPSAVVLVADLSIAPPPMYPSGYELDPESELMAPPIGDVVEPMADEGTGSRIAALAGKLSKQQRAKVEGYIQGLLEDE